MERKRIVEQGYDQIAERYADWAARVRSDERARYMDLIVQKSARWRRCAGTGLCKRWPDDTGAGGALQAHRR